MGQHMIFLWKTFLFFLYLASEATVAAVAAFIVAAPFVWLIERRLLESKRIVTAEEYQAEFDDSFRECKRVD
jgi:hypothetical protein